MKLFRIYLISALLTAVFSMGCSSSEPANAPFDNKIYIKAASWTEKIALKNNVKSAQRSLQAGVAKPASENIEIVYKDDASLVSVYNEAFYDQAEMLPAEYYELSAQKTVLNKGTVLSEAVQVSFKDLDQLSRTKTFVLPVTIVSAGNLSVLQSGRTYYYVLKSAPSIEMVADMEKKNYVVIPSFHEMKASSEVCNGLEQFTMEALINFHKFEPGIQTIMGTEGHFLLRVSDSGLKPEQLQFASPYGNLTSDQCMLTPNKWTHIAVTYDMTAKTMMIYIDGVEVARKENLSGAQPADFGKPAGLAKNKFHIAFSYQAGRELDGLISECRIWNVVRTPEELTSNVYEVDPATPGLVAYWKFNEGQGKAVRDYTVNHNDGAAVSMLNWVSVYLPAAE